MNELVNDLYTYLIANNGEFRTFVRKLDKIPTEELKALYGANIDLISYPSLLEKLTSK